MKRKIGEGGGQEKQPKWCTLELGSSQADMTRDRE
jgi:hypothetical protein